MNINSTNIVAFLKSDFEKELRFGDFLRCPIAEEFVWEYRKFLGFSDTDDKNDITTVNDFRAQIDSLKEDLKESKEENTKQEDKINELEKRISELKKKDSDEFTEIDRLIMTIKALKPSYVKTYESEDNEAFSPIEIEELINRFQRKTIERKLNDITESFEMYLGNEDMLKSLQDDLNTLLKCCPYSDLQYEIKTLIKKITSCLQIML